MCTVQSGGRVATAIGIVMSSALVEEIQSTATAAWKVEGTTVLISL